MASINRFVFAGCILAVTGGQGAAQNRGDAPRSFELKSESPKFRELFAEDARLEKVAGGFGFTEGPVWDPHGFLYVSDEEQNKLCRVYPDGRVETVLNIGDPDGSTLDAQGRLVTTASVLRAIIQVDPDGKYKVLAERYEGKKFNSPNDIILGPDGALYFTDPTLDLPKGEKQEIPFQGVYRLGNDGSVRLLTKDLVQPNGLAFSPDGKRLYIDDTKQREIRVYDVAPNGELKNGRLFGKEEGRGGVPDGMRVDVKGNIFVTGPGGIWVWDPDGNHLGTIMLPESAANLNWGDADYRTLYITAKTSVYRLKTKTLGFVPGIAKPAAALTNPFDSIAGVEHGRALFQTHCSYCHGANGEGGRGADLTLGQYRRGGSDANLFTSIRNGIPGTEMPAVRASDDEVWEMVAFVKRIGSMGLSEKAVGDPVAGKAVFESKGGCIACHSIGRDGGSLGPDLSDVGRRRNLKYLEESLLSPAADVPVRYRAIRVSTKSAQSVVGIRLNEDDISIQLRDEKDNLRSFLKENIREIGYDKPSLMPAYGTALSRKEIDDVVSYLSSLRGVE